MKKLIFLLALLGLFSAEPVRANTTYYVSTSGSDSNAGTSKGSPGAHLPGMQTYTGSHTPVAGDTYILRGCDDWGNSNFPINWTWSGSSGNLISITVDKTWYNTTGCPAFWNRPIFDAGEAVISAAGGECGGAVNNAFLLDSGNYNSFAWIEAKGFYWAGTCQNSTAINATGTNKKFDNGYIHLVTWNTSTAGDNPQIVQSPGLTGDCNQTSTNTCTFSNGVIDNTDGIAVTGGQGGLLVGGMNVTGTIFVNMSDALKTYG